MEWISVKDRLPEIGQRVLVYQKSGVFGGNEIEITYRIDEFYESSEEINNQIVWDGQGMCNDIHHWMPLPEPPVSDE